MRGRWVRLGLVALLLAAAVVSGCDDDETPPPIEVTFGDRDGDGVRDGQLTPERAARMSDDDLLIVSIGDSIAAGEGNPDVEGDGVPGRERWTLRRCHRSLWSGHAEAALGAELADDSTGVGFVPLGCSGATVEKGLRNPYRGIQPRLLEMREPAQIPRVNELAERREIDALLLSVGANDVNFSKIVKFCLLVDECWRKPFAGRPTLDEAIADRLKMLAQGYAAVDADLSDDIPSNRVVIVEYFDPTTGPGPRGPRPCRWEHHVDETVGVVTQAEFEWAQRKVLRPLNAAIRRAADDHGWRLVDGVGDRFAGHGICASRDGRWVRDLRDSLVVQGLNIHGTLHPNRPGHRATGELIAPVLEQVLEGE